MSFSVTLVGKPDAIKRKLAEHSEQLNGQSKAEFDEVRPALETILDQNVNPNGAAVRLHANGHATFVNDVKTYGVCSVSVENIGAIAE